MDDALPPARNDFHAFLRAKVTAIMLADQPFDVDAATKRVNQLISDIAVETGFMLGLTYARPDMINAFTQQAGSAFEAGCLTRATDEEDAGEAA